VRIVVTGGAGFIGSQTVDALLARGDEVVCVDNFNDYYDPQIKRRNLSKALESASFKLYGEDIRDFGEMERIFANEEPQKVIHLAAMAGVRNSVRFPLLYEEVNVKGTLNLLELASRYGVSSFILASTSSVYGASKEIPFKEDNAAIRPLAPYPATKRACELLAHVYHNLHSLRCTALRFFSVYGPRGRPDMTPYLFTAAISRGEEITLYDEGRPQRDWTYIEDIIDGVLAAVDADLEYEIINLGNSRPIVMRDFVTIIEELLGRKAKIISPPLPRSEPPITYADISKARRLLGYNSVTSVEDGMRRFVEWYMQEVARDA
jgi:UDP-glucuronate 4-epimerase